MRVFLQSVIDRSDTTVGTQERLGGKNMYRVRVGYRFTCRFASWEETSRFVKEILNAMEDSEEVKVELVNDETETETEEE